MKIKYIGESKYKIYFTEDGRVLVMDYMNNALENWNELRDIYEDNHNLLLNMGALA